MRKRQKMVKIVALVVIAAMVLSLGIAAAIAVFVSEDRSVLGTYVFTEDGSTLTLRENDVATIRFGGMEESASTQYFYDETDESVFVLIDKESSQGIMFFLDGNDNLVTQNEEGELFTWEKR